MTDAETRSVIVEREVPYPPEKIWRALTEPHLLQEWLMNNDFAPVVGQRFNLSANWGSVDCRVLTVDQNKSLSYSWDTKDLASVITWTLTATPTGTHLRMEQTGFRSDQRPYYQGAMVGWPRFLDALEKVLATMGG